MIIGFEAQRIFRTHKHGMDFVALELIRALQKVDTVNKYVVFTNEGPDTECLCESENLKIITFKGTFALWEQVYLPKYAKKYNCDILHCTSNTAPVYCQVPILITLHDIIFLEKNPLFAKGYNSYQRFGNYYRRLVVKSNIKGVRKIITVSNFEKKRLIDFLAIDEDRLEVVYNGVGNHFFKKHTNEEIHTITSRYDLPEKYMLFLGNTDPKKNTKRVITAFANAVKSFKENVYLVVADLDGSLVKGILKEAGLSQYFNRVYFTGYINNADLPAIIQGAEMFLYPSVRESFGIPILEAMAGGTAVVTSRVASMPEVAGGAAYLVDPFDEESIEEGIVALHEDTLLREKLSLEGAARSEQFKWEYSAISMLNIYNDMAE